METLFWIDNNGEVYAGDKRNLDDLAAKPRPEKGAWDKDSQDWIVKPEASEIFRKIREIFQQAILEKVVIATPIVQKDLLKMASVVERALELGLYDAAREAIKEPVLDPELEPYRQAMMDAIAG